MAMLTIAELLARGVNLAGETADSTTLTEWNTAFLVGANQALVDIVRLRDIKLWESVTLDASKKFEYGDLTHDVDELLDIAALIPYSVAAGSADCEHYEWQDEGEEIIVPGASASGTVYVRYRPFAAPLVNPTPTTGANATSPEFIPEQYQDCLVYKGMAEVFVARGDERRRDECEMKYFQIRSGVTAHNRQKRILNRNDY